MKALIVLPSYNESENITALIQRILELRESYFVCVVDDNSPDGTSEVIKNFTDNLSSDQKHRIHLIVRDKKDGRGGAVRTGIQWGLNSVSDFQAFVEMDCDFSHPPTDLVQGVELLNEADMVMGSRYPDGTIVGWPLKRRIFSFIANLLARILINWKIADYTNGFRFYSNQAAEFMCQVPQRHKGYIYLSETIAAFLKNDFVIKSCQIVFVNREIGVSNTDMKEVLFALTGLFEVAWRYRFQ
ncbi:MAG TPA: glycosyltransferase [Candidatus Marinimicrobia bacterium]|nr:glycosyltransferase [Candidatus Neomarinimicrobiota bacterium]